MNGFLKFGKMLSKETMKAITGKAGGSCTVECNCNGGCYTIVVSHENDVPSGCTAKCQSLGSFWAGICVGGVNCDYW